MGYKEEEKYVFVMGDYYEDDIYNYYNDMDFHDDDPVICEVDKSISDDIIIMPPEKYDGLNTITIEGDHEVRATSSNEYMIWLKRCDFGMKTILKDRNRQNRYFTDSEDDDYIFKIIRKCGDVFSEDYNDIANHILINNIVISYDIVYKIMRRVYEEQDKDFVELLYNNRDNIGNMYYKAIIMDDLPTIIRLEGLGFPIHRDFSKTKDVFIQKIVSECKRFKAHHILKHFEIT